MTIPAGTQLTATQAAALGASAPAPAAAPTQDPAPASLPGVSQEHYVKEWEAEKAKGAAADGEYMQWLYDQASRARPAESSAIHNQFKANKAATAAPPAPVNPLPNMTAYLAKCMARCQGVKVAP
ncbi:TPA: hypothetical protein RQN55_004118 [Aeromonas dhakensis]|nr:hypothetical protein [Aeromonas dhakensis]